MINPFKSMYTAIKQRERNEDMAYLNGASDIFDLEYRERELDRRRRRNTFGNYNQL